MSSLEQIDSSTNQKRAITAAQAAAKFRSKKEVYYFLTLDAKAYLPHHSTVTV